MDVRKQKPMLDSAFTRERKRGMCQVLVLIWYDYHKGILMARRATLAEKKEVLEKLRRLYAKGESSLTPNEKIELGALRNLYEGFRYVKVRLEDEADFLLTPVHIKNGELNY